MADPITNILKMLFGNLTKTGPRLEPIHFLRDPRP
jgi:hypothetical protein